MKLDEANVALESASRLNEQLEAKEESITSLKNLGNLWFYNFFAIRIRKIPSFARLSLSTTLSA